MVQPPTGNFNPSGEPHARERASVTDEVADRGEASRSAAVAHVQANRHHFGMGLTLSVKAVKSSEQLCQKIARGAVTWRTEVLHVVGLEAVRNCEPLRPC